MSATSSMIKQESSNAETKRALQPTASDHGRPHEGRRPGRTMNSGNVSRRNFLIASAGLAAAGVVRPRQAQALTAGEVIRRIKSQVGIPWRDQTVDNLIAGSAETPVRGIATVIMATLDAVKRAAAAGLNMVITHESTFYSHQDNIEPISQDPVYRQKLDFLNRQGMAVFHFHDHWHGRQPDGIAVGMSRALGWEKYADDRNPKFFTLPETTLRGLAEEMAARLNIRTMRVVGDPELRVRRVISSWGFASQMPGIPLLARPDVDALALGETHEWELVEYAQDLIASGERKGLIILGHMYSEQAGMEYCAEWLKGFIHEAPVEFISSEEPYWRPGGTG
jgi:putative NIF3 family GTP cyclohydrolase 1 type 2